jgi:TrmH family RNA methyltransferase
MARSCAILLGSEHAGLGIEWMASADDRVRLPSVGRADSINVAMAATVMLFEARRQRRLQPSD